MKQVYVAVAVAILTALITGSVTTMTVSGQMPSGKFDKLLECGNILFDKLGEKGANIDVDDDPKDLVAKFANGTKMSCNDLKDFWETEKEFLVSNKSYAQSEQQNFTAPKFGISMQYPNDWTFVENVYEDRNYRPGDPSAYLGTFCPTSSVPNVENPSCGLLESPASVKITTYKLEEGITSKEFHDNEISPRLDSKSLKELVGRENKETSDIKISGLPAIQRIDTAGGGDMGKVLESIGNEQPTSKFLNVYVASGSTGYEIEARVDDEKDFETYSPIFQKPIENCIVAS